MVFFQNRLCTFIRQSQLSTVIIYFSHRLYLLEASQNRAYSWACPASALLSQAKFFQNSSISVCLNYWCDWTSHSSTDRYHIANESLVTNFSNQSPLSHTKCENTTNEQTNKGAKKNDMNKLMIRQCAVCSDGKIIQLKPQIPSLISSGEWQ